MYKLWIGFLQISRAFFWTIVSRDFWNLIENDNVYLNVRKSPDCLDRLYYKDLSLMVGWLGIRMKKRKEDKSKQFPWCIRTANCVFWSHRRSHRPLWEILKPWLRKFRAKCSSRQLFCGTIIWRTKFNLVFSLFYTRFLIINFLK